MNMITEAMRHFRRAPLVDLDTPHEPSASSEPRPHLAGSSPRLGSPGVDGPAASTSPGAVGHPDEWPVDWDAAHDDLDCIRQLPEILNDCTLAELSAILTKMSVIVEAATEVVQIVDRVQGYGGRRSGRGM